MTVVPVRFPEEDIELLRKVSKARGETLSGYIRQSIRRSLARMGLIEVDDVERKALELGPEQHGGSR
jgi:hypothetical protein